MANLQFKQVTAVEAARRFSEVNDTAMREPVILTRNGRARTVLLSVETFERYLANERQVILAKDTPREFLDQIVALADGEFQAAGVAQASDETGK